MGIFLINVSLFKGLFSLERFAAQKAEGRAVFTGNGHCRCSFNRAKAFLDVYCL
jgi:hypothetical protein